MQICVCFAASVLTSDLALNHGPKAVESRRKNRGRRQRTRLEWYQKLVDRKLTTKTKYNFTNSVQQLLDQHHFACSAVDLNTDGSILTFSSALRGLDAAAWAKAYGEKK